MRFRCFLNIFGCLLLAASSPSYALKFVSDEVNLNPTYDNFSVCYGHTCDTVQQVSVSQSAWSKVAGLFRPVANTEQAERVQIGLAVALMERIVGEITGTANDKAYNFKGLFAKSHQMDCIDESTNTTTYLTMFKKTGLIKWHTVKNPVTRGFFIFGWPHNTAVIQGIKTGKRWAVDSWFYDNGEKPAIVPLSKWKKGWDPRKIK